MEMTDPALVERVQQELHAAEVHWRSRDDGSLSLAVLLDLIRNRMRALCEEYARERTADLDEQLRDSIGSTEAVIDERDAARDACRVVLRRAQDAEVALAGAQDERDVLRERETRLREALEFYADPATYVAIGFLPDPPCGDFLDDFELVPEYSSAKPGKRARAALATPEEPKG